MEVKRARSNLSFLLDPQQGVNLEIFSKDEIFIGFDQETHKVTIDMGIEPVV